MGLHEKFYDGISLLFTIWAIPSILALFLVLSKGPLSIIIVTGILLGMFILLSPYLTRNSELHELPEGLQNLLLYFTDIAPEISIDPRIVLAVTLIIFLGPMVIFWRTTKMREDELTLNIHNWNKLSLSNIAEALYQTAHHQPKPASTKITVENSLVSLSFESKQDLEEWLKELKPDTEDNSCDLCDPDDYNYTKDENEIEYICDDCLRKTIEQLDEDKEIQITDAILAARI